MFKHRLSVAAIVLSTMFGVLFWMFFIREDSYDATAKILVRIGHEQADNSTVGKSSVVITGDRSEDVNSEADILESSDLLEQLITDLHLDQPSPPKPVPEKLLPRIRYRIKDAIHTVRQWKDQVMITLGLKEALSPHEEALARLRSALVVTPERNSNIITVDLFVEQREYGAPILNRLLDLYQVFRLKSYRERGTPEFFRGETSRTADRLHAAEEQLREFENRWNISAIQKQKEVLLDQIATEQTTVNNAQIDLRDISVKADRAEQETKSQDPRVPAIGSFVANTFPEIELQELASLQADREKLRMTELDTGERIRNNRDQFRVTLRMLASHLRSMQAEKQAAYDKHAQLLASLQMQVGALQDKEGEWTALKRNVKMLEDSYLGYEKRFEDASATAVMEQQNIGNVSIIEHATPPVQPVGMSKVRILGIALLLSFLAAFAWLGIAEFLDHRIYTAEELEERLGVPVLEAVPELRSRRRLFRRGPPLLGDRYRKTAWYLANSAMANEGSAFVFSSAARGEGTSSAVAAVSEHLTRYYGLRPLVIKLDREASPAPIKGEFHPADLAGAPSQPAASALECIQKNGSGVAFLPALQYAGNGHFSPRHLRTLLGEVKPDFDIVLVDAPPISDPEALAVCCSVKSVVVVVQSGRTRYEMVERLKQDLSTDGVKIIGAVLNNQKRYIPRLVYRCLVN